jgi:hypothetical protein
MDGRSLASFTDTMLARKFPWSLLANPDHSDILLLYQPTGRLSKRATKYCWHDSRESLSAIRPVNDIV